MPRQGKNYDVVVVGAGLIGASFALLLAKQVSAKRSELNIAVVERAAELPDSGEANQRVVALGAVATHVLQEVGVFTQLGAQYCHPYSAMRVWDENTDGELAFSAAEQGCNELGHMVDAIRCTYLLQQELRKTPNIEVFYEFAADNLALSDSGVNISSNQQSLSANLVVAADGARSWVRQQAKIFANQHSYQQLGIVANITTEHSHQNTAWQRFLETGPLAILPLAGNHSSIVWSADQDLAAELLNKSKPKFAAALERALENRLGAVTVKSKPQAFPLTSQAAETYFKPGVVLIGDAAHSIHPLAGQGANLGFKDATALVDCLLNSETAQLGDLSVLQGYERKRKLDNQQTDRLMSALYAAYRHNSPWWLMARAQGMHWINQSSTLKSLLAQQAIGQ